MNNRNHNLLINVRDECLNFSFFKENSSEANFRLSLKVYYINTIHQFDEIVRNGEVISLKINKDLLPLKEVVYKLEFDENEENPISGSKSFFSDRFIDKPDRDLDLETSAFISMQTAIEKSCPLPDRITMAVVYAYNALDLGNRRAVLDAREIILNLLEDSSSLEESKSIRHNRANLELSSFTVLWHLDVFLKDVNGFFYNVCTCFENILTLLDKNEDAVNGTMAYNLVKLTNILSLVAYRIKDEIALVKLCDLGLYFINEAYTYFYKDHSNINEFSVIAEVHKSVLRNLILKDLLVGVRIYPGYIQKLLEIKNEKYEEDIIKNSFRLYSGLSGIVNRFDELLSESDVEFIKNELVKVTEVTKRFAF